MKQKRPQKEKFRKFLKFSGIGVQLGVTMYLASILGEKLDAYFQLQKPWITLLFVVLALVFFIVNLLRQLEKLNQE